MRFTKCGYGKTLASIGAACFISIGSASVSAATIYSNGFESNTVDWTTVSQAASGTGGINSASGSFHATANAGDFTRWGGYNYGAGGGVPTVFKEFSTSLDIYLDVGGGYANDTRFDFSSAMSNSAGNFLRDFVFNGGFYNDAGAGDRFVFSASNNAGRANSFPKNPGRDPFAVTSTGWYTFEHHFYDNSGALAADLSILDSSDNVLHTWTLSSPADLIAGVGGNRYGWFVNMEIPSLAIDNGQLTVADAAVPVPGTLALLGLGFAGIGWTRRKS